MSRNDRRNKNQAQEQAPIGDQQQEQHEQKLDGATEGEAVAENLTEGTEQASGDAAATEGEVIGDAPATDAGDAAVQEPAE